MLVTNRSSTAYYFNFLQKLKIVRHAVKSNTIQITSIKMESDILDMAAELLEYTDIQEEEDNRDQLPIELEEEQVYNDLHVRPEVIKAVHTRLMFKIKSCYTTSLCIYFPNKKKDSVKKFWFDTYSPDDASPMRRFPDYKISTARYSFSEEVWFADVLRWITEYLAPTNGKYIASAKRIENMDADRAIYITKT